MRTTAQKPLRFATLLKSHPRTDAPPRIQSTPAEHLSLGQHFWETAPVCQKNFEKLYIYIYIYVCVCVCVFVCLGVSVCLMNDESSLALRKHFLCDISLFLYG